MSLSKERLEEEIEATKVTIRKLQTIEQESIEGVEVNEIVLNGFEQALANL